MPSLPIPTEFPQLHRPCSTRFIRPAAVYYYSLCVVSISKYVIVGGRLNRFFTGFPFILWLPSVRFFGATSSLEKFAYSHPIPLCELLGFFSLWCVVGAFPMAPDSGLWEFRAAGFNFLLPFLLFGSEFIRDSDSHFWAHSLSVFVRQVVVFLISECLRFRFAIARVTPPNPRICLFFLG